MKLFTTVRLVLVFAVCFIFTQTTSAQFTTGAYGLKQTALNTLQLIRAFATEKQDIKRLDGAIENLTSSLDLSLWLDDSHLNPLTGVDAFTDEKKVISNLQGIVKNKKGTVPDEVAIDLINTVLTADRLIAAVAIAEGAPSKQLEKANALLAKGDENWANGKYGNAIGNYKKAWLRALKSVNPALVSPLLDEDEEIEAELAAESPASFTLLAAYPNPFNPSTTIQYELSEPTHVSLKVYDIAGREVANLVNEEKAAGSYNVRFDAGDLPSGTYFYRLHAGALVQTHRMVLLK